MRFSPVAAVFSCILAQAAYADEAEPSATASVTLSRHHTTNALDSPLALPDWYTLLRGSLEETFTHELGKTTIAGAFEFRRFDRYDIENDAAGAISATTTARVSEALELRGTLSLNLSSEGDDLPVGNFILGMRTRKAVFSAGLQAGVRLASDVVLVLEGAASRERAGATRFQEDVLPPTQLEPSRDRLRMAATLTRTDGMFSYGMFGAAGMLRAEPIGLLPEIRLADYGVRLHARAAFDGGATIAASAGVEAVQLLDGPFREVRPAYEVSIATPLTAAFSLRGMLKAGYDLASTDDPLAVWVRRVEAETAYRLTPALTIGAGVFLERRDNVGLETTERLNGLYGEAVWQAQERLSLTFRVDATRRKLLDFDEERRAVELQLAVSAKL